MVGTVWVLLLDSLTLAGNAAMAGDRGEVHVWPEMPHEATVPPRIWRPGWPPMDEAGRWMQKQFDRGRAGRPEIAHPFRRSQIFRV